MSLFIRILLVQCLIVLYFQAKSEALPITKYNFENAFKQISKASPLKKAAKADVGTAPLDINEAVGGELSTISAVVGILGGGASKLVMGFTGVSITDCAGSVKGEDLDTISCADFLSVISECDSLSNIKPLLQQAKAKYKKQANSRAPCFKNKNRKKKKN